MQCEHEGCTREAIPCYLPDDEPERPSCYFCPEHASGEGFCYGCGSFCAGTEDFDFGNGLCETCADIFEDEDEDLDEDEEALLEPYEEEGADDENRD